MTTPSKNLIDINQAITAAVDMSGLLKSGYVQHKSSYPNAPQVREHVVEKELLLFLVNHPAGSLADRISALTATVKIEAAAAPSTDYVSLTKMTKSAIQNAEKTLEWMAHAEQLLLQSAETPAAVPSTPGHRHR